MTGELPDVCINLGTKLRNYRKYVALEAIDRLHRRTPIKTGYLHDSWGFKMTGEGIEIYNVADYAAWIEFGTKHIRPVAMLRTTLAEMEEILEVAAKKAGLK